MKKQISEILRCNENELQGNLFFMYIDKGIKLAKSVIADLERLGIIITETATFYYFLNTSYCK
jgi:hypothetical protein